MPRRGLPHRNVYATHADQRWRIPRKWRYVATLAAAAAAGKEARIGARRGVGDGQFRNRHPQFRDRVGWPRRRAYMKMRGNDRSCAGTSIASGTGAPLVYVGVADVMNAKLGI